MPEVQTQSNKIHVNKIDDILVGVTPKIPEFAQEQKEIEPEEPEQEAPDIEESEPEKESPAKESETEKEPSKEAAHLDEYGNEVEKPRLYTDEDVQRMIKERLQRGQMVAPEMQQAAKNFEADPNNPEDWEVQLESFIEKTTQKLEKKKQTQAWQEREREKQANFEVKFTHGMQKYKDFKETVGKMPVTDSIMMAAREMDDPAAFLYAASKLHPDEFRKIADMTDPFTQARELGKLDEKMRKSRAISKAAPPLAPTKGDMGAKYVPKQNIDQKILNHAKAKTRR